MRRSLITGVIAASVSLVLASVTLTPALAVSPAADSPGIIKARKIVSQYSKVPTSVGVTIPLKTKPPAGKLIIYVSSGSAASVVIANNVQEAATAAGFRFQNMPGANTPEKIRSVFQAALDQKPDGIVFFGVEPSSVGSDLIAKSTQQGVAVQSVSVFEPSPAPNWITGVNGLADTALAAQAVAAGVIVSSNGAANTQIISIPLISTTRVFAENYIKYVKAMCSKCGLAENNFTVGDIGTKIPAAMVSVVQRNPNTNWILGTHADALIGLDSALAQAGLGGGKIRTATASMAGTNLSALKAGTQNMAWGLSLPLIAWRAIDNFARRFEGMPVQVSNVPGQLITNVNAKTVPVNANGDFIGVKNYQEQFKKLWHM